MCNIICLQPGFTVFLYYMHSSFSVRKKADRDNRSGDFTSFTYLTAFNGLTQSGRLVFIHLAFSFVKNIGYTKSGAYILLFV